MGEWASAKIVAVRLTVSASAYSRVAEPFISGLVNPVAVALAPDGSLLIGDWGTGTVYRSTPVWWLPRLSGHPVPLSEERHQQAPEADAHHVDGAVQGRPPAEASEHQDQREEHHVEPAKGAE